MCVAEGTQGRVYGPRSLLSPSLGHLVVNMVVYLHRKVKLLSNWCISLLAEEQAGSGREKHNTLKPSNVIRKPVRGKPASAAEPEAPILRCKKRGRAIWISEKPCCTRHSHQHQRELRGVDLCQAPANHHQSLAHGQRLHAEPASFSHQWWH